MPNSGQVTFSHKELRNAPIIKGPCGWDSRTVRKAPCASRTENRLSVSPRWEVPVCFTSDDPVKRYRQRCELPCKTALLQCRAGEAGITDNRVHVDARLPASIAGPYSCLPITHAGLRRLARPSTQSRTHVHITSRPLPPFGFNITRNFVSRAPRCETESQMRMGNKTPHALIDAPLQTILNATSNRLSLSGVRRRMS